MKYFDNYNYSHGIMFHYFDDNKKHKKSQGSIDENELKKIINFIGRKNILDADVFIEKYKKKILKRNEICLTFDDGLKSQYDVALPILNDFNIKAFFFISTSVYTSNPNLLEVYRYFRTNYYENVNLFYKDFFNNLEINMEDFFLEKSHEITTRKNKFPFYSLEDIKFRITRDLFLNKIKYEEIMNRMLSQKNVNTKNILSISYINEKELRTMKKDGHIIGLHTHNHPTRLKDLSLKSQLEEYNENLNYLSKILKIDKKEINSMAHPSGSYNTNTLTVLKDLNIDIGFKQIMDNDKNKNSCYEIPRQDHSAILKNI